MSTIIVPKEGRDQLAFGLLVKAFIIPVVHTKVVNNQYISMQVPNCHLPIFDDVIDCRHQMVER